MKKWNLVGIQHLYSQTEWQMRALRSGRKKLRAQAEEIRTLAAGMHFKAPREMMLRFAVTFDKLADRLDGAEEPPVSH